MLKFTRPELNTAPTALRSNLKGISGLFSSYAAYAVLFSLFTFYIHVTSPDDDLHFQANLTKVPVTFLISKGFDDTL